MEDLQALKEQFDNMDEKEQWRFILNHKKDIFLYLDNDNTTAHFLDGKFDEKQEDYNYFCLIADIGNRWGLEYLLDAIRINWQHC